MSSSAWNRLRVRSLHLSSSLTLFGCDRAFPPTWTRQPSRAPVYLKEIVDEELWIRRILSLASRVVVALTLALACGAVLSGCHRAASGSADVVYVVAKEAWLRDRVAPVSSKTAP